MNYPYRPLQPDKSKIRLLCVSPQPFSITEPLQCTISHVSLDDQPAPEYETISYCWGDPSPRTAMVIDGVHVLVPVNTELALRRMALPNERRMLWIDALCINQKDLMERTQQVRLMARIYSTGTQNLVYLGEEDEWDDRAFDTLEELYRGLASSLEVQGPFSDRHVADFVFENQSTLELTSDLHVDKDALQHLISIPWFK